MSGCACSIPGCSGATHDGGKSARFVVRAARTADIDAVKCLADAHRRELGFVVRASLVEACQRDELLVAVMRDAAQAGGEVSLALSACVIGFVQTYFRKDGQTTLHTIAVDGAHRRYGVGRALVSALIDASHQRGMASILLRCPIDLSANSFYAAIGFSQERVEQGKRRQLAIWSYSLS